MEFKMKEIIEIAKAQGWDTLPKDAPERKVYELALDYEPANEFLEERVNEVLPEPKKKAEPKKKVAVKKSKKKGKK